MTASGREFDGVYADDCTDAGGRATHGAVAEDAYGKVRFHCIKAPTAEELGALVHRIGQQVAKFLERRGFLARDEDNDYLTLETSDPTKAVRCLRCKAYHR